MTVEHTCLYSDLYHAKTKCKNTDKIGIDILIAIVYSAYSTYQTAHPRITVYTYDDTLTRSLKNKILSRYGSVITVTCL